MKEHRKHREEPNSDGRANNAAAVELENNWADGDTCAEQVRMGVASWLTAEDELSVNEGTTSTQLNTIKII